MRLFYPFILFSLLSCGTEEFTPNFDVESVEGYRPIYGDENSNTISLENPREILLAGKIYSYGNLLIVNEVGEGFHLLDNSNPQDPEHLFFVHIPGNSDVAIKEGIIYADNFNDLVALKVQTDSIVVLKRLTNIKAFNAEFPMHRGVYFECVDTSKGIVVGWEPATLANPECYRP